MNIAVIIDDVTSNDSIEIESILNGTKENLSRENPVKYLKEKMGKN